MNKKIFFLKVLTFRFQKSQPEKPDIFSNLSTRPKPTRRVESGCISLQCSKELACGCEKTSRQPTAKRKWSPVAVDGADDRLVEGEVEKVGAGRADEEEDSRVAGRRRRGAREGLQVRTRHVRCRISAVDHCIEFHTWYIGS